MTGSLAPTRRLLSHGSPLAAAAAAAAEAAAARNPLFRAEITRVRDIADVRILRLKATRKVEENLPTGETRLEGPFAFQAGQWVDFMAPGVEKVGGFTITSAPISTPGLAEAVGMPSNMDEFELVVKKANWPPAQWIHTAAKIGTEVQVRVGGDFTLEQRGVLQTNSDGHHHWGCDHLLLLSGGLGINPLFSMLLRIADVSSVHSRLPKVTLAMSARDRSHLLFLDQVRTLASGPLRDSLKVVAALTRGPGSEAPIAPGISAGGAEVGVVARPDLQVCGGRDRAEGGVEVDGEEWLHRRFTAQDMRRLVPEGGVGRTAAMVCGPKGFTDEMIAILSTEAGIPKEMVHAERWW